MNKELLLEYAAELAKTNTTKVAQPAANVIAPCIIPKYQYQYHYNEEHANSK